MEVLNYASSIRLDLRTQEEHTISLPQEGVLQWITEAGSKVTLRPWGTEPKMKLYLEVQAKTQDEAERRLASLQEAFNEMVEAGLKA